MGNDKNHDEIRILYGDAVTVLPLKAADAAEGASGLDCKILMLISADPSLRVGGDDTWNALAEKLGIERSDVDSAISYWRGAGVLAYGDRKKAGRPKKQTAEQIVEAEKQKREAEMPPAVPVKETAEIEPAPTEKKIRRADELPNYTLEELTALLESRKQLSLFLDECQRAYGKMFNPREVSKVVGLIDYLTLDEEYVLTLLRYFGEKPEEERKPIHYIEKMAFSLYDKGITQREALSEHLETLDLLQSNEGQIRTIFGIGARAFTAKEKQAVLRWLGEFGCSMDLIRLAYERTIHATSKPSVMYASKILERWHSEGLKTPEAVEASEHKTDEPQSGNFDTEDFFEAALRRSYGDTYGKPDSDPKTGNPQ